jgi:hypothetical protein
LRDRFGRRLGGLVDRVTVEPQSTRAWALGADGEERLGSELAAVQGIRVLNDRRVPGTRGNIDHIVIAPGGVFVIDAKHWEGTVHIRDIGSWLRQDKRLYVGRRDATPKAEALRWQIEAVSRALVEQQIDPFPRITPVLCFVGATWPILGRPGEFRGFGLKASGR